ncbi:hypothetical protein [Natronobacterium gregoryi]|uniref:Uncharacterized protein n=2 Tax=Natronobacterium gregoryi TaxID=44930 RepID=L0AJQ0_NATGS|nr:hypothetical protein [Natronobacterium gregoryi]AFZ74098.1 hypothetical protein Natgr_2962 [Natronobacterium gregoryi SP2]ELY70160.1 hypothetical protein C490_06829 [Natronobacterium gregoryi SP2]PLK18501.1 hypothetical protein CYV19_17630 [Natronobacterium gregoryi SP2]SFJ61995.1 hypothetical protein SAMN05443661_14719 [Natronobacterium gregoryi]
MPIDRWQSVRTLVRSRGEGSPPGDIVGIAAALVGVGGYAFVLGYLVQFSGPVVEGGTSPQTAASVRFLLFGAVLLALAVGLYQRRPIAWFGAVGGTVLSLAASLAASHVARPIALVSCLFLLGLLLARRNLYVEF